MRRDKWKVEHRFFRKPGGGLESKFVILIRHNRQWLPFGSEDGSIRKYPSKRYAERVGIKEIEEMIRILK